MAQTTLPGIAEKKRRVRKFKEDYVAENACLRVDNANLRNQVTELSYQLEKERTKKRSLFSRLLGGK